MVEGTRVDMKRAGKFVAKASYDLENLLQNRRQDGTSVMMGKHLLQCFPNRRTCSLITVEYGDDAGKRE